MIEVTAKDYSLIVKGHAKTAPKGYDLVCAAASILCLTLAENVRQQTEALQKAPKIRVKSGDCEIRATPKAEYAESIRLLFRSTETGLYLLARLFPDIIKVEN